VILRRLTCVPECAGPKTCPLAASDSPCPYSLLFEPRQLPGAPGPSGIADSPRPFVIRAHALDGARIPTGGSFHFDMNLVLPPAQALPYLVLSFREIIRSGLGAGRPKVELVQVENPSNGRLLYSANTFHRTAFDGVRLDLEDRSEPSPGRLTLRFLSPTELKHEGAVALRPEFGLLFRRLRDRISTLRWLYQGGALAVDFDELGRRADSVRLVRDALRRIRLERHSSRTGQTHPLGGLAGEVEYAGDFSPFLPYLRAGEWMGVGRQTVWGKGHFSIVSRAEHPI
jgi:hypothetical protein